VFPFATGLLLLVVFILPAVFVHLVTGGVDPSPVLEDMLLALPRSSSAPTRCGVCYDLVRTVERTILTSKSTAGGDVGPLLFENKRQRNLFLSSVESSVCSASAHFGTGGGDGGKASSTPSSLAAVMHGKHFRRTRGAAAGSGEVIHNKPSSPGKWNCSGFFRQHRDAIAEHIVGITTASIHVGNDLQGDGSVRKSTPAAAAAGTAGPQPVRCPLLAPLVPSIAAYIAKRQRDTQGEEAGAGQPSPSSTIPAPPPNAVCSVQQQYFAERGTGPVCAEVCEANMPWVDRLFMEVLRYVARHREVQLLCVCIREMWGVVLLLGLASGVIVLLLQLKGVHWTLQVSISEALALRKAAASSAGASIVPGCASGGGASAQSAAAGAGKTTKQSAAVRR
jgi:hypothetical protein